MGRKTPARIHIQDEDYPLRALCGKPWLEAHGGRIVSNTLPVVRDDESGSVNQVTCRVCLLQWRRRRGSLRDDKT